VAELVKSGPRALTYTLRPEFRAENVEIAKGEVAPEVDTDMEAAAESSSDPDIDGDD